MTITIKNRAALVVPPSVRRQAGLKPGDRAEFRVSGNVINIVKDSDRDHRAPTQRKVLDTQLAEGLAEIEAGRTAGPFDSANEMIAHMKGELKKRAVAKKNTRT